MYPHPLTAGDESPVLGRTTAAAAALTLGAVVAVGGCSSSTPAAAGRSRIAVSILDCGHGWHPSRTGQFHLTFVNTDTQVGEVRIVGEGGPRTPKGAVYAAIDPLGPHASANLDIALGPGQYAVQCLLESASALDGPHVNLTGVTPAGAATGVRAVTLNALALPIRDYQTWVTSRLPALAAHVAALRAALAAGDRPGAEAAWRAGHAVYETLGAAYGAFGDLDGAINGLPYGLPRGTHDPGWTGFHALEFGLWHGAAPISLVPLATRLGHDVGRLHALMKLPPSIDPTDPEITLAAGSIDPLTFSIRVHEISENALQFSLTGKDDFGAHSSLATVAANLDGTAEVLGLVRSLLVGKVDTAPIDAGIAAARTAVHAAGTGAVLALPQATRERLDAALSQLTELLAPVAVVLEPRRAS
jgi:iron uptake system component EfeO